MLLEDGSEIGMKTSWKDLYFTTPRDDAMRFLLLFRNFLLVFTLTAKVAIFATARVCISVRFKLPELVTHQPNQFKSS